MTLKVELEYGEEHIYFPGQIIRGQVKYSILSQKQIQCAGISFRGKITTEYIEGRSGAVGNTHGPRRRNEENIRLFDMYKNLFKGPYHVQAQTFEWPFEFRIPTHTENKRTGASSPGFIADGSNPIPPTCQFEDFTIAHDAKGRVKYKLAVSVQSGGVFGNDNVEIPVMILRLSNIPPPTSQLVQREILPSPQWSSRGLRVESHTLKQKFKHVFGDDPTLRTPCIAFKAFFHAPLAVSAAQSFPISFSIQHYQQTPNDPDKPTLVLNSVKLSLYSRTALTVARNGLLSSDRLCAGSTWEADGVLRFKPVQLSLKGEVIQVAKNVRLADWKGGNVFAFRADFETYIIRRTHMLTVEATVSHSESQHKFRIKTEFPFEVLEPFAGELIGDDGESLKPGLGSMVLVPHVAIDSELPGYDEDVRPPAAPLSSTGRVLVAPSCTDVKD